MLLKLFLYKSSSYWFKILNFKTGLKFKISKTNNIKVFGDVKICFLIEAVLKLKINWLGLLACVTGVKNI